MRVYRELVSDPPWQRELECREAEKLEWLARRLLEWDGVSEELDSDRFGPPTP
jgi:hypothetical protein